MKKEISNKIDKIVALKGKLDEINDSIKFLKEAEYSGEAIMTMGYDDYIVLKYMSDFGEGNEIHIPKKYIDVMWSYAREELEKLEKEKQETQEELSELAGK